MVLKYEEFKEDALIEEINFEDREEFRQLSLEFEQGTAKGRPHINERLMMLVLGGKINDIIKAINNLNERVAKIEKCCKPGQETFW